MTNWIVVKLLLAVVVFTVVLAETELQTIAGKSNRAESRQGILHNDRWWPYGWGWGWGWGIAAFVLAIVKGSILLGLFIIWAFFKGFANKKGGCAPIIIRESPPPHWNPHWDRSSIAADYPRSKRATDYTDSPLYWTDMVTDLGFSFLGVHSTDCRKRFVCEVDVRASRDPMLKFAMRMFGRDIFQKYRSASDKIAKTFEECSRAYITCKIGGPSITFDVVSGQIDPLQDYDESIDGQLDEASSIDVTTEGTSAEESYEEDSTPVVTTSTTTESSRKKYFNKRKRLFKLVNGK